jgi:hypothetical protein
MADYDHEAALRHRHRNVNNDTRVVNLEEFNADDAELAAKFGYKPVLKREFGYLSTFSFAVSISGLFSTIATTFSFPLYAGGSSSAVWCWLISGAGCMCIAVRIPPVRNQRERETNICAVPSLTLLLYSFRWPNLYRHILPLEVYTLQSRAWHLERGCRRSVGERFNLP